MCGSHCSCLQCITGVVSFLFCREMERNPPLGGIETGGAPPSTWTVAPPTSYPAFGPGRRARSKFLTEKHHCGKCTKFFMSRKGLIKHMQKIHAKKFTYVCPHCERGFVEKAQFEAHVNKHTGVRPYKCQTCTKSFRSEATVKQHAKICASKTGQS